MALVDEQGDVIAEVGNHVRLGGGYAPGETVDRCMAGDRVLHAWDVHIERGGSETDR